MNFDEKEITRLVEQVVKEITDNASSTCTCSKLTSIVIPDNVTTIGESAFSDCSSLKSISMGKGVEKIKILAFSRCTGVKQFSIKAINPPECSYETLRILIENDCTLYVPSGHADKYRSNRIWGRFHNIEEE